MVDSPPLHHYFLSILDHNMLESTDPWNSPIQIHCFYVQDANILVMLILILVFFHDKMSSWNAFDYIQKVFFCGKFVAEKIQSLLCFAVDVFRVSIKLQFFSLESSVRFVAHLPFYSSYILNLWIHEFMSDFLSFQSVSEIFPTHKYVGIHISQQWQHIASWIKKNKK